MIRVLIMLMGVSAASHIMYDKKDRPVIHGLYSDNCSREVKDIEWLENTIEDLESRLKTCSNEMKQTTLKLDAHMSLSLIAIDIYREQYEILKKENIMLVSLNPPGYIWLSNLLDYLI